MFAVFNEKENCGVYASPVSEPNFTELYGNPYLLDNFGVM